MRTLNLKGMRLDHGIGYDVYCVIHKLFRR